MNQKVVGLGVLSILEAQMNACVPSDTNAPSLVRGEDAPFVGMANSRIKRSYLLREAMSKKLFVATGVTELQLAQEWYNLADDIFQLEVHRQYPELIGKHIMLYADWSIGPRQEDKKPKIILLGSREAVVLAKAAHRTQ